jgi:hypothetical protein
MGLMDILQQYSNSAATTSQNAAHEHFEEVARTAPPSVLGQGLADAFRADSTPSFGAMVAQIFGRSNPAQQAGVLNQLVRSIGPGLSQITPEQASQLTPEQVQDIASHAEQHDPSVLDRIGGFYAQHPDVVKTLGSAALAIALAGVANRMRS